MPNLNSNLNASSYLTSRARVHFHPANWSLLFICRAFKAISRASLAFLSADLFLLSLCFSLMFTIIIESCTESGRARNRQRYCDINFSFSLLFALPVLRFGRVQKTRKMSYRGGMLGMLLTSPNSTFSVSLSSPLSDIHFFLHKM